MERSWIGRAPLVALAALLALAAGCGTPCDNARDRIESRYTECDVAIADPGEPTSDACASAEGAYQKCIADCTESASCEALTGQDATAGADFGECLADCSG